jgi:hypothetical protein
MPNSFRVAINAFSADGNKAAAVFLQIEGAGTDGIVVDGGGLSKAATPLVCKAGATEKTVKLRR